MSVIDAVNNVLGEVARLRDTLRGIASADSSYHPLHNQANCGCKLKTVIDIGPVHHPAHANDSRYNKQKSARQQSMLLKTIPTIRRTKR